ncbi:MAG: CheB methylesterase domain-containing protein [Clostridia bacterium]|nr:CheB methylesterase domain-containing protein [Clostridia bacterium]
MKNKKDSTVIAIGASTGGVEALKEILKKLPADMPPIIIVQHIPASFTKFLAEGLNGVSRLEVAEATDGEPLTPGKVLIAPGNMHMTLERKCEGYYVSIKEGSPVYRQCPSIETMFCSVAKSAGPEAVGIILTGWGKDGAKGLLEMKECGAFTIAQDERSCIAFELPKEAIELGAVHVTTGLQNIPKTILDYLQNNIMKGEDDPEYHPAIIREDRERNRYGQGTGQQYQGGSGVRAIYPVL